jgi:hypothetical protein
MPTVAASSFPLSPSFRPVISVLFARGFCVDFYQEKPGTFSPEF